MWRREQNAFKPFVLNHLHLLKYQAKKHRDIYWMHYNMTTGIVQHWTNGTLESFHTIFQIRKSHLKSINLLVLCSLFISQICPPSYSPPPPPGCVIKENLEIWVCHVGLTSETPPGVETTGWRDQSFCASPPFLNLLHPWVLFHAHTHTHICTHSLTQTLACTQTYIHASI